MSEESIKDTIKPKATLYERLKFIAVVLIILCLLLFAFNQFISWKLKAEFMMQPCGLCAKVNPNQSECINGCFQVRQENPLYRVNFSYLQYNRSALEDS